MKPSTKIRLYYLIMLIAGLGVFGVLTASGYENLILFFMIPYLLVGQLIIFARVSSDVCSSCGANIMSGGQENMGFTFLLSLLFHGKCESCGNKT